MKQLSHLLKHDFRLLNRNNIITISVIVTLVYIAVFQGLKGLENMDKILVLIIFNDPALLGFLFIGVMVLFERNEGTVEVISVSPIRIENYILSKSIALTLISLLCCYGMVVAGIGLEFNFFHFTMAAILTTLLFSFFGFVVVADQSKFNDYMLKVAWVLILLGLPFFGYFGVVSKYWFILFPTLPMVELFDLSFNASPSIEKVILAYVGSIFWCIVAYYWAKRKVTKNLKT